MKTLTIVLGLVAIVIVVLLFLKRKSQRLMSRACAVCGAPSRYGYSEHAEEDPEKIRRLCLKCLGFQLKEDYSAFGGRAVVIQPADGPPCYVFQPVQEWHEHFKKSRIAEEAVALLERMKTDCSGCGLKADYLWIGSHGLNGENFGDTLENGLSETLLRHNSEPMSLCAGCCVSLITKKLAEKGITYLEVSAPKGDGLGFVIPMGY
jgi:hypothetical protein